MQARILLLFILTPKLNEFDDIIERYVELSFISK
jgi:hypothetical protein